MPKSWKVEVTTVGDNGKYSSNAIRFPDELQAKYYGEGLFMRWSAVEKWRVVECDDPINYRDGQFITPQDNQPK